MQMNKKQTAGVGSTRHTLSGDIKRHFNKSKDISNVNFYYG